MTYSIGVYFDPQTETEIRRVWRLMAENGIAEYLHLSANRPHFTLTIFETLDLDKTMEVLCTLAGQLKPLEVSFQSIGIFSNTTAVFLAPLVTQRLLDIQSELHHALIDFASLPESIFYLPGKWVPHCGLAIDMPPENLLPAAKIAIENLTLPLNGRIIELGLTSFRPVVHLMTCKLGGE
jgi:hypothetical protein